MWIIKKVTLCVILSLFISLNCQSIYANQSDASLEIISISDDIYNTFESLAGALVKLDGRRKLLRSISFSKKIKTPYLKPLDNIFNSVKNSPIGKKVDIANKGVAVLKASENIVNWVTNEDSSILEITDALSELSAFDPTGLSGIAKTQVYGHLY